MNIINKKCSTCGEVGGKDNCGFYRHKKTKDGYENRCKMCKKKYDEENKEIIKKYQKKYYQKNKQRKKKYQKEYRKNNQKRLKKYEKKRNSKNVKCLSDKYVKFCLKQQFKELNLIITPEMIKIKRQNIILARLEKKLRGGVNRNKQAKSIGGLI